MFSQEHETGDAVLPTEGQRNRCPKYARHNEGFEVVDDMGALPCNNITMRSPSGTKVQCDYNLHAKQETVRTLKNKAQTVQVLPIIGL